MINQYQNEIIAIIIILIIIIIYLIIKLRVQQHSLEEKGTREEVHQEIEKIIQEETSQEKVLKEVSINNNDILTGSEEGDFGEAYDYNQTDSQVQNANTHFIAKRDVPQHAKITKKNFSEFSGERILVAEDNLINQKVLTGLLAGSGIEVIIANDGREALNILEKDSNFLMILMDAHMPVLDGFEATRAIRKEKKYDHILVVALSGDTASDDIKKMKNSGMAEQLEKPLRIGALYDIFYAYTGKEKPKDSSNYLEVCITKELDGTQGLEICGGDEEFYKEILSEFIQTYQNSTQELGELLKNKDFTQADKLLLDINRCNRKYWSTTTQYNCN